MKTVTFDELGRHVFHDVRFDEAGRPLAHPFNDPRFAGAAILLVDRNFGCGSSREHAPQALAAWGIRAVIGESFAEIFAGNCTAIGLPAVQAEPGVLEALAGRVEADPAATLALDLEAGRVEITRGPGAAGGGRRGARAGRAGWPVRLPETRRRAFLTGSWDTVGMLLAGREEIGAAARRLPYLARFPYPRS